MAMRWPVPASQLYDDYACRAGGRAQSAVEGCKPSAYTQRQSEVHSVVTLHMMAYRKAYQAGHRTGDLEIPQVQQVDELSGLGNLGLSPTM